MALVEIVTGISNGSTPGVTTATFGTPTTAGELIAVLFVTAPNQHLPQSMTDNKPGGTQTYNLLQNIGDLSAHFMSGFYYVLNSAASVSVITMTDNAADNEGGMIAAHYTGIAPTGPDAHSTASNGFSSPNFTSTTMVTTNPNDLLIGWAFGKNTGGSNLDLNATGAWMEQKEIVGGGANFDGGNGNTLWYADQTVSSAGTYSVSGTVAASTAGEVDCACVAFALSGAATFLPPRSVSRQL